MSSVTLFQNFLADGNPGELFVPGVLEAESFGYRMAPEMGKNIIKRGATSLPPQD